MISQFSFQEKCYFSSFHISLIVMWIYCFVFLKNWGKIGVQTYWCIFLLMRVVSLVNSQSDFLRREVKASFRTWPSAWKIFRQQWKWLVKFPTSSDSTDNFFKRMSIYFFHCEILFEELSLPVHYYRSKRRYIKAFCSYKRFLWRKNTLQH